MLEMTIIQRLLNRPVFKRAADARQKQARKRGSCMINEHFEPVFNTEAVTQIVFQRPTFPCFNSINRDWELASAELNCFQRLLINQEKIT